MNIIGAGVLDIIALIGFVWIAGTSLDEFDEDNNKSFWIRMAILIFCGALLVSATFISRG